MYVLYICEIAEFFSRGFGTRKRKREAEKNEWIDRGWRIPHFGVSGWMWGFGG